MNKEALKIIGLVIWWSEGTKSRYDKRWKKARSFPIEVTNTNPVIIETFLLFLRLIIKIPESKLRVQLQIHEGDNQKKIEKYWSKVTGVQTTFFNKTIIRPIGKKSGKSIGTCKVRFSDKKTYILLEEMLLNELAQIKLHDHGIKAGNRGEDLLK